MNVDKHTILFSALDWGLGHTTRSIPILTFLSNKGHALLIAVQPDSASAAILKESFPMATFLDLKGYEIRYAGNPRFFALKIFSQIPKLLAAIRRENRFVRQAIAAHPEIDWIISDNRYGFYHPAIKSIFITHQLRISAPFKWLEALMQRINYSYITKFQELWIPDFPGSENIGGKLSHPERMPAISTKYIGLLSRLTNTENIELEKLSVNRSAIKYLFLLSGPEPQRSVLEARLLEIIGALDGPCLLVRGLPATKNTENDLNARLIASALQKPRSNLEIIEYADRLTLKYLLERAEFVLCRSGYSTIMDLIYLGKKGIYVPTPGQTEQEYLAIRLMQLGWGYSFKQEAVNYEQELRQATLYQYELPHSFNSFQESFFTSTLS